MEINTKIRIAKIKSKTTTTKNKKTTTKSIKTFRSDRMAFMRKAMHLSQRDLSYLCNVDREIIVQIENDLAIPDKELFKSLKMVLRSNSQYLLNLSDSPGKYWTVRAEKLDGNHYVKLFIPRC